MKPVIVVLAESDTTVIGADLDASLRCVVLVYLRKINHSEPLDYSLGLLMAVLTGDLTETGS